MLASVSFFLALFAEYLGTQTQGKKTKTTSDEIIRGTDSSVNFNLSPAKAFACGKTELLPLSRNRSIACAVKDARENIPGI
jgi:hypothetical protein